MTLKRSMTTLILAGALATLLITPGCASGPKYGASRKREKGCDCPKWNALPQRAGQDVRVDTEDAKNDPVNVTAHVTHH
jgi:hypothetical protein